MSKFIIIGNRWSSEKVENIAENSEPYNLSLFKNVAAGHLVRLIILLSALNLIRNSSHEIRIE